MRDESGYQGEITAEQLASLRPGSDVPPPQVDAALVRGAADREAAELRLDPDVLEHDCGTGPGWRARVDAAMRAGMEAA